jgi:Zn-dependent protease with chaperone function
LDIYLYLVLPCRLWRRDTSGGYGPLRQVVLTEKNSYGSAINACELSNECYDAGATMRDDRKLVCGAHKMVPCHPSMRYAVQFSAMLLAILTCLGVSSPQAATEQLTKQAPSVFSAVRKGDDASAPVAVPEPSDRATRYYRSGNILWVVSQLVDLGVPALLLLTGLSAKMRSLAQRIGRKWFFIVGVYFILYGVLDYAADFPVAYYTEYVRQHAYGLSNQTFQKWLADWLIEFAIGIVFFCVLLLLFYLLIHRSPHRWWLYTSLLTVPVMIVGLLIYPIWMAPLFNRFEPMKNKRLEAQILTLASRAGVTDCRILVVDKSVDTNASNAYVTGLLATRRIVLWDTLLAKLNSPQVLFVTAHELGHDALHHILWDILIRFFGILLGLYLTYRLSRMILRRWKGVFGFEELSDVASLPLIVLAFQLVYLALLPIGLAFHRHMEHEADRFALELTQDNHAAATALARLQSGSPGDPCPGLLYTMWRGEHPSLASRIDFANSYRPWADGKPLRYGYLFQNPSQTAPDHPNATPQPPSNASPSK